MGTNPLLTVYIPHAVMPSWAWFSYVIRTDGNPTAVAGSMRAAIRTVDPNVPVRNVRTVEAVLAESVAPARWSTTLLVGIAVIASYLPARRATRVDPMIALRAD